MGAGGQRDGRILRDFENRRQALIKELVSRFGTLDFSSVGKTAIAVEDFVSEAVTRLICASAADIFGAGQVNENTRVFSCGRDEYQLNTARGLLDRNHLSLAILPHQIEIPPRNLKLFDIPIRGYGRYRRVTVHAPPHLKFNRQLLAHILKNTIETIYDWVYTQILAHVESEQRAVPEELYSAIRAKFLRKDVCEQLWFGAMSEGRGFRLFDKLVTASAFDMAHKHADEFGRGANDVVAEMLNTNLPIEQLLMRNVIGRKYPIVADISKAAYHKQQSTYSEAMRALYGSTSFSIYPVLTDVDYKDQVIALYPTALSADIEPVLHANRNLLREIAKKSEDKIRDTLAAMRAAPQKNNIPSIETNECVTEFELDRHQRVVRWNGESYIVSELQLDCIRTFYELAKQGTKVVHQKTILGEVNTDSIRLRDLFKEHQLFGTLIKRHGRGYFSLEIEPPKDDADR